MHILKNIKNFKIDIIAYWYFVNICILPIASRLEAVLSCYMQDTAWKKNNHNRFTY